jgi:hypothetical protein
MNIEDVQEFRILVKMWAHTENIELTGTQIDKLVKSLQAGLGATIENAILGTSPK